MKYFLIVYHGKLSIVSAYVTYFLQNWAYEFDIPLSSRISFQTWK